MSPECAIKVLDNQNIVMKSLEKPIEYSEISLIWRKDKTLSHTSKTFIEYIKNVYVNRSML